VCYTVANLLHKGLGIVGAIFMKLPLDYLEKLMFFSHSDVNEDVEYKSCHYRN